jgi:hypothetical protein
MLNNIAAILDAGVAASTNSYESIMTVSVGSGGSSQIDFTSISATYKHLQIRAIARGNGAAGNWSITFNGDTNNSNYYSRHLLYGDGSTAAAISNQTLTGITGGSVAPSTTSMVAANIIDLLDYSNTNKNKTLRVLAGYDTNGAGVVLLGSGLWMNTNAISSIAITPFSGTFTQYTQFALYGIKG